MIFCHTASDDWPRDHARRRNRSRIHQRVHLGGPGSDDRPDAFNRDDRIEPCARGIDADPLFDGFRSLLLDHLSHREDLRDRLDRDCGLHVTGGVDLAVGGDQGDSEQIGIDFGQGRNVVGVLALLERSELCVCGIDRLLDLGRRLRLHRYRHREYPQSEQARLDTATAKTSTHFYPPRHDTFAFSHARTLRRPSSKIRW